MYSMIYYYVFASSFQRLRLSQPSPIAVMKAVKNATEIQGMRNAHVSLFVYIWHLMLQFSFAFHNFAYWRLGDVPIILN